MSLRRIFTLYTLCFLGVTVAIGIAEAAFGLPQRWIGWLFMGLSLGIDVRTVQFSSEGLTMVEPRLTGRSGDRRYDVTAVKAFQQVQDPKMIALEGVDGRLELTDGNWAKIESTAGNYDGNHEKLDLSGDVTVVTSTGWRATTLAARVDLVSGRIDAEGEVRITGRTAKIDADRLEATDEGRNLVFTGDVRMTVQPEAGPAASPDAARPAAP